MRQLYILFLALIITLVSCDGRDRKHKTNAEVLKENKLLNSFTNQIKYFPEQYIEVFTDTILSTGFQIKIKYHSLDNDYITKTSNSSKNSSETVCFKNFKAKFQILKNNNIVAQNIINKKLFSKYESLSFLEKAILQFVWIDYENSTKNFITLNTSLQIPETEIYKDFSIIIDKTGEIKIREVNFIEKIF